MRVREAIRAIKGIRCRVADRSNNSRGPSVYRYSIEVSNECEQCYVRGRGQRLQRGKISKFFTKRLWRLWIETSIFRVKR
jgi:hypothetical protein